MAPETIAGRYRVEREVGRGGMGAVWLCRDELLGRPVAIKRVGHLAGESTTGLARAMREARYSAALNHRNVVSIYDAVEDGDHLWLVMEYVPGRTLAELIAADGPLPPQRVAWIGAQVADGLAAAHERGTVHRDVKPGNVLVTDDDIALISDFGIARAHGDPRLTQSGLVSGTPAYFSPELARGEQDASPAADVWALGATLYAAVEGRTPYPKQTNALATLTTIANERPSPPTRAGVLAEPLGRMMDPDPHSRWAMSDVAHALHRIHERHVASGTREDVDAPPVSPPVALPSPAPPTPTSPVTEVTVADPVGPPRRRRIAPILLVVAALLLVAGAGYAWWSATRDEPATTASSPPTDRGTRDSSPEPSPSSTASQTPSSSPSPTPDPGLGSKSSAVRSYYALLPGDTRTAWGLLSPGFQDRVGGYGHYQGFWNTIDRVDVQWVRPAGIDSVDVALNYVGTDGGTDHEVRRLFLVRNGDGYLISGDSVVG